MDICLLKNYFHFLVYSESNGQIISPWRWKKWKITIQQIQTTQTTQMQAIQETKQTRKTKPAILKTQAILKIATN